MPKRQNKGTIAKSDLPESLRYPVEVFYSDEDGGFIAIAKDLPGCSAFGKTQASAVSEIRHAIEAWQQAARAAGNPVPPPSRPAEDTTLPSGKILLRVPRTLHAWLIECAKKESVSLNQHLVSVLSTSVGMTLVQQARQVAAAPTPETLIVTTQELGTAAARLLQQMRSLASLQYLTSAGPISVSIPGNAFIGRSWSHETINVVRPGESIDVKYLTAGLPVILEP